MLRIDENRRYTISEVSEHTGVQPYVLRQWESRFPQLKPRRNRANRRQYGAEDIRIVLRIKQLLWHEKMTTAGAKRRLGEELRGEGRPQTKQEAQDLVDEIEQEVRSMLDLLDSV